MTLQLLLLQRPETPSPSLYTVQEMQLTCFRGTGASSCVFWDFSSKLQSRVASQWNVISFMYLVRNDFIKKAIVIHLNQNTRYSKLVFHWITVEHVDCEPNNPEIPHSSFSNTGIQSHWESWCSVVIVYPYTVTCHSSLRRQESASAYCLHKQQSDFLTGGGKTKKRGISREGRTHSWTY